MVIMRLNLQHRRLSTSVSIQWLLTLHKVDVAVSWSTEPLIWVTNCHSERWKKAG